jgi:hypothetical protein
MSLRGATLVFALILLTLPACGGGGGTDAGPVDGVFLNAPEKELVGEYRLTDFTIYEPGVAPYHPSDFETWTGAMTLREDRTATVAVELCEHAGSPSAACDREFAWTGDAGLIHFHSLDASQPDVLMSWGAEGMGAMETHSNLPTNDESCGLLLGGEGGRETFSWARVE